MLLTKATGFWPASPTGPTRTSPLSPATGEVTKGQIGKALLEFGYRSKRMLLPCVAHWLHLAPVACMRTRKDAVVALLMF